MRALLLSAKALSDPTRVRIVRALLGGELCVCELCDVLGVVQSTLSTHLRWLRLGGLVEVRQQGRWVYYGLSAAFARLSRAFFAEHLAEVRRDAVLREDARRRKARVSLRRKGVCAVGFSVRRNNQRGARGRVS